MSTALDGSKLADRRLHQLDLLQRLTEAVNRAERLEAIYEEAVSGLLGALDADRSSLVLFLDQDRLRFVAWRGLSEQYRAAMVERTPWHRDTRDPQAIVIADVHSDEMARPHLTVLEAEGIAALVIVPLVDAGELMGRLVTYYDRPHHPSADDVRLAETIARHVALAISRRRSWQALAEREATFTALVEQSPDIITRFDRERRHLYVNPAVEEATGIPRDQFIGRTNEEVGMPREMCEEWNVAIDQVFDSGQSDVFGFEFPTPTGLRYFESSLVPESGGAGTVTSVLVTTRELTERRRAENRLRFLIDAGTLLASSLDLRTTLDAIVRIAADALGDLCAIDVMAEDGRIERLALHARDERTIDAFAEMERRFPSTMQSTTGNIVALRTGRPQLYEVITDELMRAASSSEAHYALWQQVGLSTAICVPLIARDRRLGVVSVGSTDPARQFTVEDLDVLVELARRAAVAIDHAMLFEETRRARDDAQNANAAKANFLAVMSHELRTPLAAILGYAELIADEIVGPVNATQREQLERIRASGTHLLMLIEEILSFARIDAGHESLRLDEVDVREILTEAAAVVQPLVQKKRLQLHLALPADPMPLHTDAGKLRQILLNLLGNAVKFTEHGSVTLSAREDAQDLCLTVSDTGVGIPAEHLQHVFDAFWQVEHVTTRRKGGTGLGLSVARQLARLMGGDIFVDSRLGAGSSFEVRLPK